MSEMKWAITTGADGGMGTEITRVVAKAGYRIAVVCYHPKKAEVVHERLSKETGNPDLEVIAIDLSSMQSAVAFASQILERNLPISLLMNNVGAMETGFHTTSEGFGQTVSASYMGPYLLTRKLAPLMMHGAHIVDMVSCTYAIGKLDFPDFFHRGKTGMFWRTPVYGSTKLALLSFTFELSERLRGKGVSVNTADPGIASTDVIIMHKWFDLSTDIFFHPFIRKPKKGASTAIGLLLGEKEVGVAGQPYVNNHRKNLSDRYANHVQKGQLWEVTERALAGWLK